ncbi:HAD family hydrolase [Sediminimonas qiaohouensis]|uniref:HAD family hydrolase n=1 Tax=Sediminimonas qiaohouensis TaxID=552061 RepID=UPI0003FDA90F|nr:HAD family hydrolase [Sediminimonas qiaohouensis]
MNTVELNPLTALIFDVDGTLSETEELHRHAFNAAFKASGLDWHWTIPLYRALLMTTGGKERIRAYIQNHAPGDALSPDQIAQLHADKTRRYGTMVAQGHIALRPGIAGLIAQARAEGLHIAIATTTSRSNVDALIRATFKQPAAHVFDVIAAGDEVANKKPAPDVYNLALRRLGLLPTQALALEDSRNGLLSAHRAGIACVVSPGPYTLGQDFALARAVLDSFADLRLSDWQQPGTKHTRRMEWP